MISVQNQTKTEKIKPRFKGLSFYLNIFLSLFCLLRRWEPADEEDGPGCLVEDEEDEGVVRYEVFLLQPTAITDHGSCGRRRLRALLVHLHEGLVYHLRQEEISFAVHARQVGLWSAEHVRHAQLGQRLAQLVVLLQLELWQVNVDVWLVVLVFLVGPFLQPLLRQLLLQLEQSKYILSRL